jgi:hypothetical protein
LGSVEWAETEIDGGGFPGDVKLLRRQIRDVRAELQSLPRKANIRPWQSAPAYSISGVSPGAHQSASAPAPVRALQVFISYFEKDSSAEDMATFAKVALSGAGREHEELELVIKRVGAYELVDCVRARGHTNSRADGVRVLLCATDETDSRAVRQVLEQICSVKSVGAQVLDYGYNLKVADVTKTLHVSYQPYAAKPQRMQWVEEIIRTG